MDRFKETFMLANGFDVIEQSTAPHSGKPNSDRVTSLGRLMRVWQVGNVSRSRKRRRAHGLP